MENHTPRGIGEANGTCRLVQIDVDRVCAETEGEEGEKRVPDERRTISTIAAVFSPKQEWS